MGGLGFRGSLVLVQPGFRCFSWLHKPRCKKGIRNERRLGVLGVVWAAGSQIESECGVSSRTLHHSASARAQAQDLGLCTCVDL